MIKTDHMSGRKFFIMIKTFCLIITGLLSSGSIMSQHQGAAKAMPLFQSDEILDLNMEADFKTVFANYDDSTYYPASLTLTDNAGQNRTIDIRMRTRGKTRREGDVCRFKPLRLDFPKKGTENTPFEGQKAIKLVTHCDKADYNEQNTIMEYLIYKAYNVLTDSSFKVRPAMINYINPGKKADTIRKFAFFLEREKFLAERLHGVENETQKMNPTLLSPFQTCLMDMFQYMIGNTDYSSYDLHNIILISDSASRLPPYPVPYDFDWSGLVSASYAVPHPVVKTETVTERVYRGFKKDEFIVYHTIQLFKARKQQIYNVFENFPLLETDDRKQAIKYLDEFYETINNDRKIKIEFFDNARVVHE